MNSDIKDSLFARNAIDCEKKQLSFSAMGLKYALTCSIILTGHSYKNLQINLQDFQARKFFCIAIEFIYVPVLPCKVIGQDFLGLFDSHLVPVRDNVNDCFFYIVNFEGILVFTNSAHANGMPPVREIMQRKPLRFWQRGKLCLWRNRDIDGIGAGDWSHRKSDVLPDRQSNECGCRRFRRLQSNGWQQSSCISGHRRYRAGRRCRRESTRYRPRPPPCLPC